MFVQVLPSPQGLKRGGNQEKTDKRYTCPYCFMTTNKKGRPIAWGWIVEEKSWACKTCRTHFYNGVTEVTTNGVKKRIRKANAWKM